MSSRRRRRGGEDEAENHERWAVSYADMMTVMVALFIVLYAISAVDEDKFDALRRSLASGFGQPAPAVIAGGQGPLDGLDSFEITPDFATLADDDGFTSVELAATEEVDGTYVGAVREYSDLDDIRERIEAQLEEEGLLAHVTFQIDERGLVIGMVGSNVYFAADDATLTPVAKKVVMALAGPLHEQARALSVEGHANVLPSNNYPTNWELSSDRATQVLRRFVEHGNIPPDQIMATGFGDARPLHPGMSDKAMALNRRVDVVVQSLASEDIRALLPDIAEAIESGDLTAEDLQRKVAAVRTLQGGLP